MDQNENVSSNMRLSMKNNNAQSLDGSRWKCFENMPRDKIKLNNKKHCCRYPDHDSKEFKTNVPQFEHCQALYTKCDYLLEKFAHEILLKLEDQFKSHCSLMEEELNIQNELLDNMWVNSQKYLILTRSGICVKPYPEIISAATEKRSLCSFHLNLRRVNESNYCLTKSLEKIRTTMDELERHCFRLDNTVESPFLVGTFFLRPLKCIRSILTDLFSYIYQLLLQLKSWAELLDPGDCVAIEDYIALIKSNIGIENHLVKYLEQCSCLRLLNKD